MSQTILLDRDTTPYMWSGDYMSILKHGGNKFPLINQLREMLSGKFRLVLKLSDIRSNLYVNGKPCLVRKRKNDPITVYPHCKIIEGVDAGSGGSVKYPNISFKGGTAIVEVITDGFPHLELNHYSIAIDIMELERIN